MSLSTEKSGGASTLTPPELNPLLNPLLAQNMGRWAQVYFTSPPEKRDQAVHELVRELEAENSKDGPRVVTSPSPARNEEKSDRGVRSAALAPEVQPTLTRCHACGRKNLTTQKFCGMCGTRLGEEAAAAAVFDDHSEIAHPAADLRGDYAGFASRNDPSARTDEQLFDRRDLAKPNQILHDSELHARRLDRNELSLFQAGNDREYEDREYFDDDEDPIFSTPPSSGSSGIVVGLLLVVAIGVAVYLGWPKVRATLESLRSQPAASSTPVTENSASQPAPSNDSNGTPTADTLPTDTAHAPASPVVNAARKEADNSAASLPHGVSRPPRAVASGASAGTGAEELAVAQGYLNGSNGRTRNSSEGAKWLWKAIAKHNPDATLLLSDLYLKGDGVSKNCDQARVLLDSAAMQGVKSAGERLRHLQAFGCR